MKGVVEAIKHMHESGYVHRDIKPENLMFVGSHLKLIDFGTVKDVEYLRI